MASSSKKNEENLAVETYCCVLGTKLLLIKGAYFEAEKLLK